MEYKKEVIQSPIDSTELETLIEEIDEALQDLESKKTPWGKRVLSSSHMLVDSDDEGDGIKIVQFVSPVSGAITTNKGQADNDPNAHGSGVPSIPMFVEVTKSGSDGKKIVGSTRKEKSRRKGRNVSATRRGISP